MRPTGDDRPRLLTTGLVVLLALSASVQLAFVFGSPAYLLQRLVADDAFYYFEIARNFLDSGTFTFDTLHLTNGFHPLYQYWTVLLTPLARDPITLIRLVLFSAVVFHLIATVLLHRLARRWVSPAAALWAAALWALSPALLRINLLGLENSLLSVLLLSSLLLFFKIRDRGREASWQAFFGLGVVFGLGFLARIDEFFWIAIASLVLLGPLLARRRAGVGKLIAYCLPMMVIVLPFLLSNWLTFHHLFPVSGAVKRFQMVSWLTANYGSVFHPSFLGLVAATTLQQLVQWLGYISAPFWSLPVLIALAGREFDEASILGFRGRLTVVLLIGAVLLLAGFLWRRRLTIQRYGQALRSPSSVRSLTELWPFLVFTLVHYASYAFLFYTQIGYADKWYFIPEYLTTLILVVWMTDRLFLRSPRLIAGLTVVAVWLSLGFYGRFFTLSAGPFNRDYRSPTITATKIEAAAWVNANLPADAIIGTWNAGLVGYLIDRPVVHLEGLVNDYEHLERTVKPRRTLDYLREEGITYLADYEGAPGDQLTTFYGIPLSDLEKIFDRPGGTTVFYVFRLRRKPSDQPP